MQLDKLVLYNEAGEVRDISFRSGELNVITGDSRTGKSSLIGIIRFLLGSKSPNAPFGQIRDTVAWYGLHLHVNDTRVFVARKAPPPGEDSNDAMLLVGDVETPSFDELEERTTRAALRQYLGGLIGIEDNRTELGRGQAGVPPAAQLNQALFYCFQGQGEIANPDILFHRQNREWRPQAIRTTLPYFLGAQGPEDLRRREELAAKRREFRLLQTRVRAAQSERHAGLDRAGALVVEARNAGMANENLAPETIDDARVELRRILDTPVAELPGPTDADEFDRLRDVKLRLTSEVRQINERIRGLERFAAASESHGLELAEQGSRLASIGLIPADSEDAECALCGSPIDPESDAREAVVRALGRAEHRLELAQRDTPRIAEAREELLEQRRAIQEQIADADRSLGAIAASDELAAELQKQLNLQSYVRGRIAQYLETSEDAAEDDLDRLERQLDQLSQQVNELTELLDADAIRSRTASLMRTVSRQMTEWAQGLGLEHSSDGVYIDPERLTIVADTPHGAAYMDTGGIGSGLNWVGYHITAYLALQRFFIENARPVPSFIVLDQLSQAFFPRDRTTGGDLEELSDTDRENTRRLYELIYEVVAGVNGALQVIALDHADFGDEWFASSVIERWRGGRALIPQDWYEGETDHQAE